MDDNIDLVAHIAGAYLGNPQNNVRPDQIGQLLTNIHTALANLGQPEKQAEPVVPKADARAIRRSITPDALISFIDGKPYKTLKRHLTTQGTTPEQYRRTYGLPADYPMTAPNYSLARSEMAKSLGLGTGVMRGNR